MKSMEEKLAAKKVSISELKVKLADANSRRHVAKSQLGELKAKVKATRAATNRAV